MFETYINVQVGWMIFSGIALIATLATVIFLNVFDKVTLQKWKHRCNQAYLCGYEDGAKMRVRKSPFPEIYRTSKDFERIGD